MHMILLLIAAVFLGAGSFAAAAESQIFTLQKTDTGYVRTNTSTGETSICTQTGDQLVCRLAADDFQAFEADLSTLQNRIDSLEKRISALEKTGSTNPLSQPQAKNEEEFKNSLDHMEQFFRRFMGIVKEFQTFGDVAKPAPDHT